MDMDIHGYPQKICGYGYGYGCEISYPRQPCPIRTFLLAPQIRHLVTLCAFINFIYLLTYLERLWMLKTATTPEAYKDWRFLICKLPITTTADPPQSSATNTK